MEGYIIDYNDTEFSYRPCQKNDIHHIEMRDMNDALNYLYAHPLLRCLNWNNVILCGGYVSRLLCGDNPTKGDIDLFMYGSYDLNTVKDLMMTITSVYGAIQWHYSGSVITGITTPQIFYSKCDQKRPEIQIVCTNEKTAIAILANVDSSYAQVGFDGRRILCSSAFIKYTPYGIAKIIKSEVSNLRILKAKSRGFSSLAYPGQYIIFEFREKPKLVPTDIIDVLCGIKLYGQFGPSHPIDKVYYF